MKLKNNIDFTAFLLDVRKCQGEVNFFSHEGDQLNLKSLLSEFIFVAAANDPSLVQQGRIICQNPEDYALIAYYLEEAADE